MFKLEYITETQGPFPDSMLDLGIKTKKFFKKIQLWTLKVVLLLSTSLSSLLHCGTSISLKHSFLFSQQTSISARQGSMMLAA